MIAKHRLINNEILNINEKHVTRTSRGSEHGPDPLRSPEADLAEATILLPFSETQAFLHSDIIRKDSFCLARGSLIAG